MYPEGLVGVPLRACLLTPPLAAATFLLFAATDMSLSLAAVTRRYQHAAARFWSRVLLRLSGVRLRVAGLENIPSGCPCVFAVNHQSLADTPVMMAALPVPFRFLAKQSLWRVPIIGGHLRRGGHIPVRREEARQAMQSLVEAARVVRERAVSVLVFAEGTRSAAGLGEFKSGAAHVAIQTGVPLVPVAVAGTAEALPKGAVSLRAAPVRVCVGEPIPTAGMTAVDRDTLTGELRRRVAGLLKQMT